MVVAVAYEYELAFEDKATIAEIWADVDIAGVAYIMPEMSEETEKIKRAMRKQYGASVQVAIMSVDGLEV